MELIPVLLKGIKELDSSSMSCFKEQQHKIDNLMLKIGTKDSINAIMNDQVDGLFQKMNSLQDQLNQIKITRNNFDNKPRRSEIEDDANLKDVEISQTDIKLNDSQFIVLEQNVPNPFAEQTIINYTLPDNTRRAQMLFYNAQGKLIQLVDLIQKGKGILNVFASDLSSGIYTYTLLIDGEIVESKKMMKE